MRKRPFLLLEILIGLTLAGFMISMLFSFLKETIAVEKKFAEKHVEMLARQRLLMRLQDVFMMLCQERAQTLFTEKFPGEKQESLVFLFDQGIDLVPAFSGKVMGKLYLDGKNNLCLATWPLDEEITRAWRNEVLFADVKQFELQFLGKKIDPSDEAVNTSLAWSKKWPKKRADVPSQIRLTLTDKQGTQLRFAFAIPTPEPVPTYYERGIGS